MPVVKNLEFYRAILNRKSTPPPRAATANLRFLHPNISVAYFIVVAVL